MSSQGLEDGGQHHGFLSWLCISQLGTGVPARTMELGLGTAGLISTTANKVFDIKCVTGAHLFLQSQRLTAHPAKSTNTNLSMTKEAVVLSNGHTLETQGRQEEKQKATVEKSSPCDFHKIMC